MEPVDDVPVDEPVLDEDARRPVISTSWFTCGCSSLVLPSSMYVDPDVPADADPVVLVPAVDDVDPERDELLPDADVSMCALVSMNRPLELEADDPVVPVVLPVVPVEPLV